MSIVSDHEALRWRDERDAARVDLAAAREALDDEKRHSRKQYANWQSAERDLTAAREQLELADRENDRITGVALDLAGKIARHDRFKEACDVVLERTEQRDAARAELAGLRQRIEALCDKAEAYPFGYDLVTSVDLRAALAGDP